MTEREKFNALHRHEWELQGSAGVWESYYMCGKCGKRAREDGDGPALSADGCTQARATPQVPEGMALVPTSEHRQQSMAHEALQRELSMIHSTIESFESPAAALRALIDWHCAVGVDPSVNGGKVLVPVNSLHSIMELAGVTLVYQPFGSQDRQHFDALLAATKEKGE